MAERFLYGRMSRYRRSVTVIPHASGRFKHNLTTTHVIKSKRLEKGVSILA
jgi:hypothetical protein